MAAAVRRLIEDETLALRLGAQGRRAALQRFSTARYRSEVTAVVTAVAERRPSNR